MTVSVQSQYPTPMVKGSASPVDEKRAVSSRRSRNGAEKPWRPGDVRELSHERAAFLTHTCSLVAVNDRQERPRIQHRRNDRAEFK